MEKLRSLSVPKKHFFQTGNPITHEPENPHFNPKRLNTVKDSDPSSIAESPIMRTEANLDSREDFRDNYRSLPSQGSPYANSQANVHRSRPSGSWGEFIVKQGELAQAVDKNFRIEDKIRTLKYREALDQMIQDGKNKKMDMRREMKQPTHDPQQMQEFLRQEKIRELEDKRYYNNELQRVIKEKEDLRKKEQLQRQQEILEQRRMTEQLHEFEQRAYIQGKIDKKQTFNQYQAQIGLKQQTLQYHKHKEELDALEQNQFFAKQDEERRKLYEKIKTRADTQVSKPAHVVEREYEKYKQIENFINKSVQEKIEKDTIEMMRRNEAFKKAQHDASELNRKQAMERNLKSRNDKKTEHEEFGYSLEQRKFVDQMEHLRREQDLMQKRGYYESLKSQAQAREEAKIRENAMSNAERIVNFRRTRSPENFLEEASANSLPLNGRSYERNLQLRYIDNWLTNTTQNHQQNL